MQSQKPRPRRKTQGGARAFAGLSAAFRALVERFPLSALGLFLGLIAAGGLIFIALPHNDLILLVICASALAILALALLCSTTRALILWLYLRKNLRKTPQDDTAPSAPLKLECGVETRGEFALPALRFIPLSRASWQWEQPQARIRIQTRQKRLRESITPQSRARMDTIVRRIEITDAFGLTRILFRARQSQNIRIYPWLGQLKAPAFAQTFAEGGDIPFPHGPAQGEPSDFRRYVMGDPVRFILWKTFAKSRQLIVRTPEQAYSPVRRTAAYLVTGERDEATAAVARAALESGALGTGWTFGADGTSEVAKDRAQALEVLAGSKHADAQQHAEQGGTGLYAFLKKHADGIGTRIVLFVPPAPGPWLERTITAVRKWQKNPKTQGAPPIAGMKIHTGIDVLIGLDGYLNPIALPWYKRLLFLPTQTMNQPSEADTDISTTVSHKELARVASALSPEGAQIAIIDRRTGRISRSAQARLLFSAIFSEQTSNSSAGNTTELKTKSALSKTQQAPPAERTP